MGLLLKAAEGKYGIFFKTFVVTIIEKMAATLSKFTFSVYRVFWGVGLFLFLIANGPGDLGSIPGRVIPKTLKMELDTTLLNTQHYKVRFKGKVEQSREWSCALPYTLV